MKQKQRRRKKKETKKEPKESKQRKTRRKEERKEQERDRERGSEKGGGQKRLRRNKGRHSKISKNALFRGKTGFFSIKSKERKRRKKNNTQNKEGLGPSEVALRATSPDP